MATKDKERPIDAANKHPDYQIRYPEWVKIRDCMKGEKAIKDKKEAYLPRPAGMSGEYASAYDAYIERAHFPLIVPYALSGALGVIITKLPEFNLPPQLKYLEDHATIDGRSLPQLFMDIIIEIFQTGRVPLTVDITPNNQFRFVQYKAENFINWKASVRDASKSLTLAVFSEREDNGENIFSHEVDSRYKVMLLKNGKYSVKTFDSENIESESYVVPEFMGNTLDELPVVVAGSINNSIDIQPIPLVSVANCSIQIYRKEADLANSEFLSCNPTLVIVGADSSEDVPNVVGSSVMMVLTNDQARVFYTETDTAALQHVKEHIKDLYEEAIRHGVAILDARKGVEAAEALRIRQATQSASIYSVYLSAMTAILAGLKIMCKWYGISDKAVDADAPSSLSFGVPDASLIKELVAGFADSGVIPLTVVHKYLVASGLLDQTIGYEEYLKLLEENKKLKEELGLSSKEVKTNVMPGNESGDTSLEATELEKDQTGGPEEIIE